MRLISYTTSEPVTQPQVGAVVKERVIPLLSLEGFPDSMLDLIRHGQQEWDRLRRALAGTPSQELALKEVTLLAPIPRPSRNILCLGWNYSAHASESSKAIGQDVPIPEHPIVFTKAPSTANRPRGEFVYDRALTEEIDWEVELGVIIGKTGKGIPVERALDHVFGYLVINDISARDIQRRHKQFFLGKSLDGACPMGPWIVTADEIADPQELRLRCYVNDVLKQDGTTADQIFSVAETISILSRGMTLEAGDIIATGTPDGVGFARTPPEYLGHGDIVRCEIEEIGYIETRISTKPH